jgi:hypothetical protein
MPWRYRQVPSGIFDGKHGRGINFGSGFEFRRMEPTAARNPLAGRPSVCQLRCACEAGSTSRRPLHRGGTNKQTNLVTVCRGCHADSHEENVYDPNEETNGRWLPTVEEVSRLVRSTHHPLKRAVLGLFAKIGIGVGELYNLHIDDVFLDDRDVAEAYDIRKSVWVENSHPALRICVEGNEPHASRRMRFETTVVPLDEPMCRSLKYRLAVRPDSQCRPNRCFSALIRGMRGCLRLPSGRWSNHERQR